MKEKVRKTDEEWRELLTREEFAIARQGGTERPFTGAYWDNHDPGVYHCVCCGEPLFSSSEKYDSGTGWPSFRSPLAPDKVIEKPDMSRGMRRTEVLCSRCDAHLGHLFNDGPPPTGLRYCLNSASLAFERGRGKERE